MFLAKYFRRISTQKFNLKKYLNPNIAFVSAPVAVPRAPVITAAPPHLPPATYVSDFDKIPTEKPNRPPLGPNPGPEFPRPPSPSPPKPEAPRPPMPSPPPPGPDVIPPAPPQPGPNQPDIPPSYMGCGGPISN